LLQPQPITKDNSDAARALFGRALAIDPNYAAALARCSSLVDWPVYPRLAHTMLTATAQAQSGVEEPEVAKAAERVEIRGARRRPVRRG
jgi:hypothetical protein